MSISTLGDKERKETGKCFQRLNCDATVLSIRFLFILYIYWTLKVFSIEEEEATYKNPQEGNLSKEINVKSGYDI